MAIPSKTTSTKRFKIHQMYSKEIQDSSYLNPIHSRIWRCLKSIRCGLPLSNQRRSFSSHWWHATTSSYSSVLMKAHISKGLLGWNLGQIIITRPRWRLLSSIRASAITRLCNSYISSQILRSNGWSSANTRLETLIRSQEIHWMNIHLYLRATTVKKYNMSLLITSVI